jgi:hypothetical protein
MNERHITNIPEYLKTIKDIFSPETRLMIYRGQPTDQPLLPKIARKTRFGKNIEDVSGKTLTEVEKTLIDEFRRRSIQFIEKTPDNAYDWLAFAQHFGLLTRLLDWTENALAALWFAVKDDYLKKTAIVWAFAVPEKDIIIPTKDLRPFQGTRTKIFKPNQLTSRISVQSGWFTLHKYNSNEKRFIPLEKHRIYKNSLVKIKIPNVSLTSIKADLDSCGINQSSLFPDLDGLCDYLNWATADKWIKGLPFSKEDILEFESIHEKTH